MIRNAVDMEREIREKMRGGNGKVEINHIFKMEDLKGKARLCARVVLEKGCSIGWHEHLEEEEIYYIIKGIARVNDNGAEKELNEGDAVLTGGGAGHSIENAGDEPLELLAVVLLYN